MVKQHNYSFFGQNTGLIINSPSDSDPFFFMRCIKRKSDGNWEKPSNGEGKVIKISLEETIMILDILNRKNLNWTGYHTFNDDKTQITFGWEDKTAKKSPVTGEGNVTGKNGCTVVNQVVKRTSKLICC